MSNTDEYKLRKQTVIILICIVTLLTALISISFAFFSASVNKVSEQSVSVNTSNPVALVYGGETNLELLGAFPGESTTSSFTVTNPSASNTPQIYDLFLTIDYNSFVTVEGVNQLTLSIIGSEGTKQINGGKPIDLTNSLVFKSDYRLELLRGQRIANGTTQTFAVTIKLEDLDNSQNSNQGQSFRGHITVENIFAVS